MHHSKYLEWIPFEKFQDVTYVAKGGFGEIYKAKLPEGIVQYWNIDKNNWKRIPNEVALKILNDSSDISKSFINEVLEKNNYFIF